MRPRIRPFDDRDAEAVVALSLRAWAPAFASLERVLGPEIFERQHPDWREDQRRAVEEVLATNKGRVWIAEVDERAVGFVAVEIDHPERGMGETSMLAVDPDYQGGGIGTSLTEFALERLKDAGMTVAMVETGETPGTPRRGVPTRRPATPSCPWPGTSRTCSHAGPRRASGPVRRRAARAGGARATGPLYLL